MKITIVNPVYSTINKPEKVKHLLVFQKEFWKTSKCPNKNSHRKTRVQYPYYLLEPKKGVFFTGFVPRVSRWIESKNLPLEIIDLREAPLSAKKNTELKGITLREDQLLLIDKAIEKRRGLIIAPTGSGKTVVAAGIINCFIKEKVKILFLCHTISLLTQTAEEFRKFGFDVSTIGAGSIDIDGQVVVSTMQTFGKMNPDEYKNLFSMVIVDEAHHISSEKGVYHRILKNIYSPIRIGFTATPPINPEAQLICEGLLGEVIGETTLEEGKKKGFLSEPEIKFLCPPKKEIIRDLRTYKDIYDHGIVNNRVRNRMIVNTVGEYNNQNKTCLVYVNRIDHLNFLMSMGNEKWEKVLGETEGERREELRKKLHDKSVKCIVSTTVWKEGVNIPSLDVIINAAGGKSEIAVLQTIGRGLRRTENKNRVIIVDFLDLGRYLSEHTVERIGIYNKNGWI